MMKRLITTILTLILTISTAMPTMAAYSFGGVNPGSFAAPTLVEPVTTVGGPADESSNINRSKDSAIVAPAFGSPDSNTPGTGELLTPNISGVTIVVGSSNNSPTVANSGNTGSAGGTQYTSASAVDPDTPPQVDVCGMATNIL